MNSSEKYRFWQSHIDQWPTSGMTQAAYCQTHDLKLATFQYWRKRLREKAHPIEPGAFVPLVAVGDSQPTPEAIIVVRVGSAMLDVPLPQLPDVLKVLGLSVSPC
jgi:transposase-like protein